VGEVINYGDEDVFSIRMRFEGFNGGLKFEFEWLNGGVGGD